MADETKTNPAAEEAQVDGAPEGQDGGGKKKKKMLMMISIGVAVLGAVIGGGVFFMLKGGGGEAHDDEAAVQSIFFDLPQFSVNLMSEAGQANYLKAKIALEFSSNEDMAKATALVPVLQDDYQAFFRQMRVEDFRGNAALVRLKDALMLRTNQILAPVQVKNVLFREILVQ